MKRHFSFLIPILCSLLISCGTTRMNLSSQRDAETFNRYAFNRRAKITFLGKQAVQASDLTLKNGRLEWIAFGTRQMHRTAVDSIYRIHFVDHSIGAMHGFAGGFIAGSALVLFVFRHDDFLKPSTGEVLSASAGVGLITGSIGLFFGGAGGEREIIPCTQVDSTQCIEK